MAPRRTQVERSSATREALVRAARRLFAHRGFADVGTEELVAQAGLSRGALYHHFADKTELFAAVYEAVEGEVIDRITATVSGAGQTDPIARLRRAARAWFDACSEAEVRQIAIVDAPAVLGLTRWREISTRYGLGLAAGLLTEAMDLGRIARQPVSPLAHVLLGALREGSLYLVGAPNLAKARREVGDVIDRLIAAMELKDAG